METDLAGRSEKQIALRGDLNGLMPSLNQKVDKRLADVTVPTGATIKKLKA
jgi:hypothetical protein